MSGTDPQTSADGGPVIDQAPGAEPTAAPAVQVAPDLKGLIDQTAATATELADLLDQETGRMKTEGANAFTHAGNDKLRLVRLYRVQTLALAEKLDAVRAVPEELKAELRTAVDRLEASGEANAAALDIARKVAARMVALFADAARETLPPPFAYGKAAQPDRGNTPPVAIDTEL